MFTRKVLRRLLRLRSTIRDLVYTAWLRAHGCQLAGRVHFKGRFPDLDLHGNGILAFGANVTIGDGVEIMVYHDGVLKFGDGCYIGSCAEFSISGVMEAGENTLFVRHSTVYCEGRIDVGPLVLIAVDCLLTDVNHRIDNLDVAIKDAGNTVPEPVNIGEGVWLGAGVRVMPGVSVGCGAVVGAGAVVTKNIPPMAIAVGTPAKVIRYRTPSDAVPHSPDVQESATVLG